MYLIYSGVPIKYWVDTAKYGNIFVDLKIK